MSVRLSGDDSADKLKYNFNRLGYTISKVEAKQPKCIVELKL
jgi:hypothetical protein